MARRDSPSPDRQGAQPTAEAAPSPRPPPPPPPLLPSEAEGANSPAVASAAGSPQVGADAAAPTGGATPPPRAQAGAGYSEDPTRTDNAHGQDPNTALSPSGARSNFILRRLSTFFSPAGRPPPGSSPPGPTEQPQQNAATEQPPPTDTDTEHYWLRGHPLPAGPGISNSAIGRHPPYENAEDNSIRPHNPNLHPRVTSPDRKDQDQPPTPAVKESSIKKGSDLNQGLQATPRTTRYSLREKNTPNSTRNDAAPKRTGAQSELAKNRADKEHSQSALNPDEPPADTNAESGANQKAVATENPRSPKTARRPGARRPSTARSAAYGADGLPVPQSPVNPSELDQRSSFQPSSEDNRTNSIPAIDPSDEIDIPRLTVKELRTHLRRFGLPMAGRKADLQVRLRQYLDTHRRPPDPREEVQRAPLELSTPQRQKRALQRPIPDAVLTSANNKLAGTTNSVEHSTPHIATRQSEKPVESLKPNIAVKALETDGKPQHEPDSTPPDSTNVRPAASSHKPPRPTEHFQNMPDDVSAGSAPVKIIRNTLRQVQSGQRHISASEFELYTRILYDGMPAHERSVIANPDFLAARGEKRPAADSSIAPHVGQDIPSAPSIHQPVLQQTEKMQANLSGAIITSSSPARPNNTPAQENVIGTDSEIDQTNSRMRLQPTGPDQGQIQPSSSPQVQANVSQPTAITATTTTTAAALAALAAVGMNSNTTPAGPTSPVQIPPARTGKRKAMEEAPMTPKTTLDFYTPTAQPGRQPTDVPRAQFIRPAEKRAKPNVPAPMFSAMPAPNGSAAALSLPVGSLSANGQQASKSPIGMGTAGHTHDPITKTGPPPRTPLNLERDRPRFSPEEGEKGDSLQPAMVEERAGSSKVSPPQKSVERMSEDSPNGSNVPFSSPTGLTPNDIVRTFLGRSSGFGAASQPRNRRFSSERGAAFQPYPARQPRPIFESGMTDLQPASERHRRRRATSLRVPGELPSRGPNTLATRTALEAPKPFGSVFHGSFGEWSRDQNIGNPAVSSDSAMKIMNTLRETPAASGGDLRKRSRPSSSFNAQQKSSEHSKKARQSFSVPSSAPPKRILLTDMKLDKPFEVGRNSAPPRSLRKPAGESRLQRLRRQALAMAKKKPEVVAQIEESRDRFSSAIAGKPFSPEPVSQIAVPDSPKETSANKPPWISPVKPFGALVKASQDPLPSSSHKKKRRAVENNQDGPTFAPSTAKRGRDDTTNANDDTLPKSTRNAPVTALLRPERQSTPDKPVEKEETSAPSSGDLTKQPLLGFGVAKPEKTAGEGKKDPESSENPAASNLFGSLASRSQGPSSSAQSASTFPTFTFPAASAFKPKDISLENPKLVQSPDISLASPNASKAITSEPSSTLKFDAGSFSKPLKDSVPTPEKENKKSGVSHADLKALGRDEKSVDVQARASQGPFNLGPPTSAEETSGSKADGHEPQNVKTFQLSSTKTEVKQQESVGKTSTIAEHSVPSNEASKNEEPAQPAVSEVTTEVGNASNQASAEPKPPKVSEPMSAPAPTFSFGTLQARPAVGGDTPAEQNPVTSTPLATSAAVLTQTPGKTESPAFQTSIPGTVSFGTVKSSATSLNEPANSDKTAFGGPVSAGQALEQEDRKKDTSIGADASKDAKSADLSKLVGGTASGPFGNKQSSSSAVAEASTQPAFGGFSGFGAAKKDVPPFGGLKSTAPVFGKDTKKDPSPDGPNAAIPTFPDTGSTAPGFGVPGPSPSSFGNTPLTNTAFGVPTAKPETPAFGTAKPEGPPAFGAGSAASLTNFTFGAASSAGSNGGGFSFGAKASSANTGTFVFGGASAAPPASSVPVTPAPPSFGGFGVGSSAAAASPTFGTTGSGSMFVPGSSGNMDSGAGSTGSFPFGGQSATGFGTQTGVASTGVGFGTPTMPFGSTPTIPGAASPGANVGGFGNPAMFGGANKDASSMPGFPGASASGAAAPFGGTGNAAASFGTGGPADFSFGSSNVAPRHPGRKVLRGKRQAGRR